MIIPAIIEASIGFIAGTCIYNWIQNGFKIRYLLGIILYIVSLTILIINSYII